MIKKVMALEVRAANTWHQAHGKTWKSCGSVDK